MAITPTLQGTRSGVGFIELDWTPMPSIVANNFNTFGMDIRSMREPLHRAIRDVMTKSLRMNFDVGGRPAWEPLTNYTINRKGGGKQILVDSGKLRRKAGQINIWAIGREQARLNLPGDVFYGGFHQTGWTTPDGVGAPARPWALIQPQDADNIEEIFFEWIEERAARAGLEIF